MVAIKYFIQGVLFFWGVGQNPIHNHVAKSDRDALAQDWKQVGMDLRNAMNEYGREK